MIKFDSIYEAVRHIRKNLPDDLHEVIYLMKHEGRDRAFVTDDDDELAELMSEDFYNWGFESGDPEQHAEQYKVWAYVTTENKEKWKTLYAGYKRSPISNLHIRGKATAAGEVIAIFSVARH